VGSIFRTDRKDAGDDGAEDAAAVKPDQPREEANAEAPEAAEAGEAGEEAEPFDVQTLFQMAPFMSKAAVDELLLENREKLTPADIARFAPYASQECLEKLIQTNDAQLDWDVLRKVAPFLRRDMVDNLARTAAKGKRTVRRAMNQSGINTDDLGRTMQDVGQKIGEGVERALRRASKLGGEVMEEVSSALSGMVESVRERQSRAEALRKAACERALQDENWEWLADHVGDIKDEELLRQIAQKANGLGMHDWVLEHLNGYADTRTIDAAIEAGNWGWLGDHVWQFEPELQEKIALAAAKQENWQWLATYADQISMENCADEVGLAAYKAQARVLANQIATHCMNDAQREKLADAAVEAGDFDFFEQLTDILTPEYVGRVMVAAAQAGEWERVKRFADSVDSDSIEKMMELAIAAGNFDAIDALDKYL
jgi:hypothetical protein